jgi:hypothetical protein
MARPPIGLRSNYNNVRERSPPIDVAIFTEQINAAVIFERAPPRQTASRRVAAGMHAAAATAGPLTVVAAYFIQKRFILTSADLALGRPIVTTLRDRYCVLPMWGIGTFPDLVAACNSHVPSTTRDSSIGEILFGSAASNRKSS